MKILDQISVLGRTVRIVQESSNLIVEANFTMGCAPEEEISKTSRGWHFIGVTGADQMDIATNIMKAFITVAYGLKMSEGLLGLNRGIE